MMWIETIGMATAGVLTMVELIRQRGDLVRTVKVLADWIILPIDYARGDKYYMIRRLGALAPYRQRSLIFRIILNGTKK